ncbi:MAG TPA: hypothetical protein DDZ90_29085, partial [Planctomycetaceae bacterium]|nr:hypothetical protein [Planctomycetaceae bacterium]
MTVFISFRDGGLFCGGARVSQEDLNKFGWRTGLTEGRSGVMPGRCCGEGLRCAATRRITLRMSKVSSSANLENKGCFIVKNTNDWSVFQCTVN